ncbi:zeta toxin family protein [Candidatus Desantisbacteria bacterium]|nr:zeta toxin family protein [Candidatus Desantisbacteria bacterium]
MNNKNAYIIAGPNGSGKTTFAMKFLPEYIKCPYFVNADLIAQGLSPFSPQQAAIKAGKLVLEQIHELVNKNLDFSFESTLSGRTYIKHFKYLKDKGYKLHIFFLWIPTSELAIARIKERVADGGHNIPTQDIIRRFERSISNFFKIYKPLSDSWILFNNAGIEPKLIAQKNGDMKIIDKLLLDKILNKLGVKI